MNSNKRSKFIYLTFDGLLQPLGESQIVRVVERLAEKGHKYSIVSLERSPDLQCSERVDRLRERLKQAGIEWIYGTYGSGSSIKIAGNFSEAIRLTLKAFSLDTVLIHARGYHSALVAAAIEHIKGTPYIFDARGRWVDERVLQGRWFGAPPALRLARLIERSLYQRAQAVVTLTSLHADDIRDGNLATVTSPLYVIPTCASYEIFESAARNRRRGTDGKLALLVSGSNKAMCHHPEAMVLAKSVLDLRPDAHLLILSGDYEELVCLARACGVPAERMRAAKANPEEMPNYLAQVDWAIHLVSTAVCNRGMFPTKLAEFFASGVRPVHFGCNEEVSSLVKMAGTGYVLSSLKDDALNDAAEYVARSASAPGVLLEAGREKTRRHLDLSIGVERYDSLLRNIKPDQRMKR